MPLAARSARATFFDDSGKSVPPVHSLGPVVGARAQARQIAALDADQADGVAAEMRVPDDRGLGAGHRRPALEAAAVLVDQRLHDGTHREGALAARIGGVVEDLADGREAFRLVGRVG